MFISGVTAVLVEGLLTLQHGLRLQSQLLVLVLLVIVKLTSLLNSKPGASPFTISAGTCIYSSHNSKRHKQVVYNVSACVLRYYKQCQGITNPERLCTHIGTSAKSSATVCTVLVFELPDHTQLCALGAISTILLLWHGSTAPQRCAAEQQLTALLKHVQLAHMCSLTCHLHYQHSATVVTATLHLSSWCWYIARLLGLENVVHTAWKRSASARSMLLPAQLQTLLLLVLIISRMSASIY
jgi:hypothetical protein